MCGFFLYLRGKKKYKYIFLYWILMLIGFINVEVFLLKLIDIYVYVKMLLNGLN